MSVIPFFDQQLLAKYNTSGPRYTSYPTALEFNEQFCEWDFSNAVANSKNDNLSLYLHIPFCHSLCYYCGCNKIVTRQHQKADIYLDYLAKEIAFRAPAFKNKTVNQIHLGGGTPSFLTPDQLARLVTLLRQHFNIKKQLTMSIEIDPREIELDFIDHIADLGFNRISIGVQDTALKVQQTINRVQSSQFIALLVNRAKQRNFNSINIDLIYGLPHQTQVTFAQTIAFAKAIEPDRISLFSYAHLPSRFASQRKFKDEWLPSSDEKLALMKMAVEGLTHYGYELIGMDHFAKPDDELAIAQREGRLHRNFQGYTIEENSDLLGLGVSSISAVGNSFSQNSKVLKDYYQCLEAEDEVSLIEKGLYLTQDDLIRSEVIKALMCNLIVTKADIEQKYAIDFDHYFDRELASLNTFVEDGLMSIDKAQLKISPKARLLVRNICMTFDAYMQKHINQQRFSRVI
ncbi:MAG: oxygen-independent coproporphyrinogen III oxidase [Cognaticolwellia aestuarii]